jgi:hypothetical protein
MSHDGDPMVEDVAFEDRFEEEDETGDVEEGLEDKDDAMLKSKLDNHLTDKYVDELCWYMASSVLLPTPNLHPTSLHLLKKICAVGEVKDYERHVCENDCMRFEDIPARLWGQREEEECTHCGSKRFTRGGRGGKVLIPKKVFWEMKVDEIIKSMFGDREWSSRRGVRRYNDPLDFYSSPEAKRVDEETGGALSHPDNSVYELCMDSMQCFDYKQHSVGLVGLR